MNANHPFRGRLLDLPASLVLLLSAELLKWQVPVYAAAEKLSMLTALLRPAFDSSASQVVGR